VTKTGLVVGTPEYMSPEQLSGDTVDGRSDIYSLALVAFRMFAGTLPFQADTAQEVMIKRLTDQPLRLDEAAPGADFPPALQQVLDQGLQRMPSDRYSSAGKFGADLVNAVSGMADAAPAVDVDGATQLLDSSEITDQGVDLDGATEAMPSTRFSGQAKAAATPDTPMPPTAVAAQDIADERTKKKPPVAAIAAVVGTLVIGGGAVMVIGGGESEAAPGDSLGQIAQDPVTQDTEPDTSTGEGSRPEETSPPPGDQERSARRDSNLPAAGSGREMTSTPTEDSVITTPERVNPGWMSLDRAEDHLVELLISLDEAPASTLEAVRDTATSYYNALGIGDVDRATAAYVTAQAFGELGDSENALLWARRALDLDPDNVAYQGYVTSLQGGQGS
jgi:serine/threonine-protein kinase